MEERGRIWAELKIIFNTSTEASVAVNLVVGWVTKYKRARGRRSFARTRFLESESDLSG